MIKNLKTKECDTFLKRPAPIAGLFYLTYPLMKKYILLLGLSLFMGSLLYAQAPFTGGKGDGYASVSLTSAATGIAPTDSYSLQAFPNPVKAGSSIQITASPRLAGVITITCWDLHGKPVHRQVTNTFPLELSTAGWAKGTYVLVFNMADQVIGREMVGVY